MEQKYVTAAMVLAFDTDPIMRWLYPDSHQYLNHVPELIQIIGDRAYAHQTVYAIDGYAGAAFWLPPGIQPNREALEKRLQHSVFEAQQPALWELLERLQQHHPPVPHWRLSLLAVEPAHRRRGYGSALMQDVLIQCDRQGYPAYVEATQATHLPFFQRLGFALLTTVQVGNLPPLFPMMRAPNSSGS